MPSIRLAVVCVSLLPVAWAQTSSLPSYTIGTLAGNGIMGFAGDGGPLTGAQFNSPIQIALDKAGNLYIADTGNNRIREIMSPSSGASATIKTIAGSGTQGTGCDGAKNNPTINPKPIPALSANLGLPQGVTVDPTGTVYIGDTDNSCVRKLTGGMATVYAGNGIPDGPNGLNGDGGNPLLAYIAGPTYLALDSSLNLYISDPNNSNVREVVNGEITVAAIGSPGILDIRPKGLAFDQSGTLYVVDGVTDVVFKENAGFLEVFAGGGAGSTASAGENIPALSAILNLPSAIAFDNQNNLLIVEERGCRVRRVSGGNIQTIAGPIGANPTCGPLVATPPGAVVPAISAQFNSPQGIAVDPNSGGIYIADSSNNAIRVLTPSSPGTGGSCAVGSGIMLSNMMVPEPATTGTDQFNVTVAISNCQWMASTSTPWITGLPQSGGSGTHPVTFTFAANTSSQPRTGTITVTGMPGSGTAGGASGTVTVMQAGVPCTATLSPTGPVTAPPSGATGQFNIMFQASDCQWQAASTASWLNVTSGASGAGNGTIQYTAAPNMATTPLVGSIVAASTPFTVLEAGAAPMSTGAPPILVPAPPFNAPGSSSTGTINVSFPPGGQGCAYNATTTASWIILTSGTAGSGVGAVGYTLEPNTSVSPRSGAIVICGQSYTILQAGAATPAQCTPMFTPASPSNVPATGGTGSVGLTFPTAGCGWIATSNVSWLTVTSGPNGTGNGSLGYSIAANATAATRTGVIAVAGQSFTITQAASTSATSCTTGSSCPTISSVVSASAYGDSAKASPGSIVEVYGSDLANDARMWASQDFNGPNAPTSLDGVTVNFNGQPGYVSYVSPLQVNAQIPTTIQPGSVQVTVTNQQQTSAPYTLTLNAIQPGLLAPQSFNVNGKAYVVAFLPDGSYVLPPGAIAGLTSRQAHPGEAVTMYGIGLGPALNGSGQTIGGGLMAPGLSTVASPVDVQYGGTSAVITYAGLAPGYVGLYQVNVVTPQIPDNNLVPLTFTINGTSYQTLFTAVKQ